MLRAVFPERFENAPAPVRRPVGRPEPFMVPEPAPGRRTNPGIQSLAALVRRHGAMEQLVPHRLGHDALTVANRLDGDSAEVLERAGGHPYLVDLSSNAIGTNVEAYAGIVRKWSQRRAIAAVCQETAGEAGEHDSDAMELASNLAARLDALCSESREANVLCALPAEPSRESLRRRNGGSALERRRFRGDGTGVCVRVDR